MAGGKKQRRMQGECNVARIKETNMKNEVAEIGNSEKSEV